MITVKNWAQKTITVKKVLEDILLSSTRRFDFTYSYVSPIDGSPVSGQFALAPLANDAAGASRNLTIPVNATDLVITELTTDAHADIGNTYDTVDEGVWANNNNPVSITDTNASETVFAVATVIDNGTITYTNTRKTIPVTVQKTVDSTGGTFEFTALLQGVQNYTLNDLGTAATTDDIVTNASGSAVFNLTVADGGTSSIVLMVPYGVKLTVTETADSNYTTTTQVGSAAATEALTTGQLNITEAITITFVNSDVVLIAPTGVDQKKVPYMLILIAGLMLMAAMFILRRRTVMEADCAAVEAPISVTAANTAIVAETVSAPIVETMPVIQAEPEQVEEPEVVAEPEQVVEPAMPEDPVADKVVASKPIEKAEPSEAPRVGKGHTLAVAGGLLALLAVSAMADKHRKGGGRA